MPVLAIRKHKLFYHVENRFRRSATSCFSWRGLTIEWHDEAVLGVVVAAEGYPGDIKKDLLLQDWMQLVMDAYVYHAGTAKNDAGQFVSNGGRVLTCCSKR